MQNQTFSNLGLSPVILKAVEKQGYSVPTEIQAQAIPSLLLGRDLLGTAQTGTGKTAAFVLPLLQRLISGRSSYSAGNNGFARPINGRPGGPSARTSASRPSNFTVFPAALILAPTRELAIQIDESISQYGEGCGIKHTVIFGGAPKPTQAAKLRRLPEILTATPGRLMDFIEEGIINLSNVRVLVLDEADRMLDMGFIPPVRRIAGMTANREQTLLFSATMPTEIEKLSRELLRNPQRIAVAPQTATVPIINQSVLYLEREDKIKLLPKLIRDRGMFRVIVFTKTKHKAARLAQILHKERIPSDSIHGDRSQNQRQRALENFRSGMIQVLVATDVASRGIDVDDITHVINYEIPHEPESYIHRIGRTGRAGNGGDAISLCDTEELSDFRAIEKLLGAPVSVDRDHIYHREAPERAKPEHKTGRPSGRQGPQEYFSRPRNGGSPKPRQFRYGKGRRSA